MSDGPTEKIAPLEQPDAHERCSALLQEVLRWAPDVHPDVYKLAACALSVTERERRERNERREAA